MNRKKIQPRGSDHRSPRLGSARRWSMVLISGGLGLLSGTLGIASDPQLLFPHLGDGAGFVSEIILTNPSPQEDSGTIVFKNSSGQPLALGFNGILTDHVNFLISPGGLFKLRTDGQGEVRSGYAVVHSQLPTSLLFGSIVFGWSGTEVSIPSSKPGLRHHAAVENGPTLESAVALVNYLDSPISVELLLLDDQGGLVDQRAVRLEAEAQLTAFLTELLSVPESFSAGTIHARSADPFAILALRQRATGSLAALPSADFSISLEFNSFGNVTVNPDLELDGRGKNVDSLAFWEAPDASKTLLFVTAKSSELVEVWRFPFIDNEQAAIEDFPGPGSINGVLVDQQDDLLFVSQAAPTSRVYVYSLPDLSLLREFGPEDSNGHGSEPNLGMLRHRQSDESRLYVTVDKVVYMYRPETGELLHKFTPQGPKDLESIVGDEFYQRLYIPDENDRRGVFAFDPTGQPFERCDESGQCSHQFGQGVFEDDGEGILLYTCPSGGGPDSGQGFILVSDQREKQTDFELFDRETWAHLGTLRIAGVNNTDGVASTQLPLPGFPLGILAVVDSDHRVVGVGWDKILQAGGLQCGIGESVSSQ